ncbi:MAG: hypothetical protein ACFFEY_17365 [Candidatus Thorarchaeota archaeon]
MKIFDWVTEIEDIYDKLIEKSKNDNLKEIEDLRAESEKILSESIQKKQELVNDALKSINIDVNKKINEFQKKLTSIIQNYESNYEQNKKRIIDQIITKLELDFNA